MKAWQCIGCGRLEAPQTCVGICQDRKVELVLAQTHQDALDELASLRARVASLETLVRRIATTHPRDDAWAASYRALQEQARTALAGR